MRTAFIEQLIEEAKKNDKIFLLVGDLGYSVVEKFAQSFPDRYLNVGIAEQNMAGIAAGLAMTGFNVYIYSIGNFPTLRCIEQLRNDIAYYNGNVKIVAVGAGYAYGSQGVSHHATEDIGIIRTIPNMVICSPGDPIETKAITTISAKYKGTMYLRLGKAGETIIHKNELKNLALGDLLSVNVSKNSKIALLVNGSILSYAVQYIQSQKLPVDIFSIPFVKPINIEHLSNIAEKYSNIIVLEEHQKSCGVGSAILEIINDIYADNKINKYPKIQRIAINDKFYSISGSQTYLRKLAGLTLDKINLEQE